MRSNMHINDYSFGYINKQVYSPLEVSFKIFFNQFLGEGVHAFFDLEESAVVAIGTKHDNISFF